METKHEKRISELADALKRVMKEKGIKIQDLEDSGINKQQAYSVLRMGNPKRPNYTIETLMNVSSVLGVTIKIG